MPAKEGKKTRCLVKRWRAYQDSWRVYPHGSVVLSKWKEFGPTDLGQRGIENFFMHHKCGRWCQASRKKPLAKPVHECSSALQCVYLFVQSVDLGATGMQNFFAHHQCNHRCQTHWKKPSPPAMKRFTPVSCSVTSQLCNGACTSL